MARRANNPTEFQSTTYAIEDLAQNDPIPQTELLGLTAKLESDGMSAIRSNEHKANYVADRARKVILKLANVETVPPLTQEHRDHLATSLGHWTLLVEQTTPRESVANRRTQPTPTRAMSTAKPKR